MLNQIILSIQLGFKFRDKDQLQQSQKVRCEGTKNQNRISPILLKVV